MILGTGAQKGAANGGLQPEPLWLLWMAIESMLVCIILETISGLGVFNKSPEYAVS
jgi:hypothetical protein